MRACCHSRKGSEGRQEIRETAGVGGTSNLCGSEPYTGRPAPLKVSRYRDRGSNGGSVVRPELRIFRDLMAAVIVADFPPIRRKVENSENPDYD